MNQRIVPRLNLKLTDIIRYTNDNTKHKNTEE